MDVNSEGDSCFEWEVVFNEGEHEVALVREFSVNGSATRVTRGITLGLNYHLSYTHETMSEEDGEGNRLGGIVSELLCEAPLGALVSISESEIEFDNARWFRKRRACEEVRERQETRIAKCE